MPYTEPLTRAHVTRWLQKWRWYGRAARPWNRVALNLELARRSAFARGPLHGNALEMLRSGRLLLGAHVLFEPDVWLTSDTGRITLGEGTICNIAVQIAAVGSVRIGAHCMLANGCVITDGDHRTDDPTTPVPWQGFTSRGPVVIGDNVWLGAHVVVTSGVTIGERAVIGANSVVTHDIPPFSVAAGAPAQVLRTITYP